MVNKLNPPRKRHIDLEVERGNISSESHISGINKDSRGDLHGVNNKDSRKYRAASLRGIFTCFDRKVEAYTYIYILNKSTLVV